MTLCINQHNVDVHISYTDAFSHVNHVMDKIISNNLSGLRLIT